MWFKKTKPQFHRGQVVVARNFFGHEFLVRVTETPHPMFSPGWYRVLVGDTVETGDFTMLYRAESLRPLSAAEKGGKCARVLSLFTSRC